MHSKINPSYRPSRLGALGWAVAGALALVLVTGAFQDTTPKYGFVDIGVVVEGSQLREEKRQELTAAAAVRNGLLDFVDTNRAISSNQADEIRQLETATDRTEAQTTRLETLKQEVVDANAEYVTLTQVNAPDLTDEQRARLGELSQLRLAAEGILNIWFERFGREMELLTEQVQVELTEAAQEATRTVAAREGYTLVFDASVAPYAANDLTEAVTAEINN